MPRSSTQRSVWVDNCNCCTGLEEWDGGDNRNDDDGETSADEDAEVAVASESAATKSSTAVPGASRSSLEDRVLGAMHNLVDKAHSMMLQLQQAGGARSTELLQQHANSVFAGNTEESTHMKATDWLKYCNILHPGGQSDIALVGWPPSVDGWVKFLLALRPTVGSYKRFQGVVGNVIEVATRFWSQRRDMPAAQLNPAFLYDAMHHRTLHIVKRSWGMGVTQVEGITMLEARNAVHFADSDSVRGIAACAAFCL